MAKLDARGVQNAIKYGMSREAIAKKYNLDAIEDEIKKIYPHNWAEILIKIDKNVDKRKSAKNQRKINQENDRAKEIDADESEESESQNSQEEIDDSSGQIKKLKSKLDDERQRLEKLDNQIKASTSELQSLTKKIIKINAANEISSETELNFNGYEKILMSIILNEEYVELTIAEARTLAKVCAIVENAEENFDVRFERKKLDILFKKRYA